jgi:rSAM/selenodomain-associated transferase 1
MRDTVIVFARAPRLGAVKRRLARDIGARAALHFHVSTLTALLHDLRRFRRFDIVLAVTPDGARVHVPAKVACIGQGHGDLGERMTKALRRYRHGRVALIGCDIPDAGAGDLQDAFRRLGTADAVFGPAEDGGYWLIALGPRRPADLFGHTRWSSEHALADTLRQFHNHRVGLIRVLSDVDTITDWQRWMARARRSRHSDPPAP